MKISVFTSNQPRHISLLEKLSKISDKVYAVIEANTVFPGQVQDFYRKSSIMQEYFSNVIRAEREVFGEISFIPGNVKSLILKDGDLNKVNLSVLKNALDADFLIVFGASYIKDNLCEQLVEKKTLNIHMGISPYYRGSSCNFWALYDHKPEMVGGTVHLLTKGLDSGPMFFHAFPKPKAVDPFVLGMQAVYATHSALIEKLANGELFQITPQEQNRELQIRYTRNADFTDEIAKKYLQSPLSPQQIYDATVNRKKELFLNPVFI